MRRGEALAANKTKGIRGLRMPFFFFAFLSVEQSGQDAYFCSARILSNCEAGTAPVMRSPVGKKNVGAPVTL